jgi:hypothetical protein
MKLGIGIGILFALTVGACAAPTASEDDAEDDGTSEAAQTGAGGYVYFHGMGQLGFSRAAIRAEIGTSGVLTPRLTDAQINEGPSKVVVDFLGGREGATIAGYSLGRVPVLRLMKTDAPGFTRVVLIDPTYDGSRALGWGVGGSIARTWLDEDESRTLLFVYGDVTRQIHGEASYLEELADHPRADLCYVPGDHARFRAADMAAALDATSCAELIARLR